MATPSRGKPSARKRTAIAVTAIVAVVVAVLAFSLRMEPVLDLRDATGRRVAELPVPDGRFDHVFIHSFHLTPVIERFVIERSGLAGARLRLYELRYQDLGTGMPDDAELGYRLEDGYFVLTMNRVFAKIPIMVSIVPGHGVVIAGTMHPFSSWVLPEHRITLEGRYVPVFRFRR